jgi:sigma-B regulation protein RsbU (phosphoserine phosphatase)
MGGDVPQPDGRDSTIAERLKLLLDTIAEVASTLDLETLLVRVVDRSLDLTRAERGLLLLVDDPGARRPRVARDRSRRNLPLDLAYSQSVVADVLRRQVSRVIEVGTADSGSLLLSESMHDMSLRRMMCVPLVFEQNAIGAIYVDSSISRSRPFADEDLRLFEALAQQAAIAIVKARLRESELRRERLEARMRIAGEIQRRAQPPSAMLLSGFDVHGVSVPCEETGGDYFDYIPRPGRRWGLIVGDVVGHGLEAALHMLTTRGYLRSSFAWVDDESKVFEHLNEELQEVMRIGEFVPLLHVELDVDERSFRFLAAGHPPPLLYRAARGEFEELPSGGPALGTDLDIECRPSEPVAMEDGDVLVLYTDGITETRRPCPPDAMPDLFGDERLRDAIRSRCGESSQSIVEGVFADVATFQSGGDADDDRTIVVVTAQPDGADD